VSEEEGDVELDDAAVGRPTDLDGNGGWEFEEDDDELPPC